MPQWPSAPRFGGFGRNRSKNVRFLPFAAFGYGYQASWTERKNTIVSATPLKPLGLDERLQAARYQESLESSERQRAALKSQDDELISHSELGRELEEWEHARQPGSSELVSKARGEGVHGVEVPQWIVEMWQEISEFGRAARRLGLPERTVKNKLPYYREAMVNWTEFVVPSDSLMRVAKQYGRSGEGGRFKVPEHTYDRKRGKRFEMPRLGLRSIVFANLYTMYLLTKVNL